MENDSAKNEALVPAVILAPQWAALFFGVGLVFLLVIGVSIWFLFDLSAASDRVFAVEALVAGLAAIFAIRKALGRDLVLFPKVHIPFVYLWLVLCLYVFLVRPFE